MDENKDEQELSDNSLTLDESDGEGVEELSAPGAPLPASDTNVETDETPQQDA